MDDPSLDGNGQDTRGQTLLDPYSSYYSVPLPPSFGPAGHSPLSPTNPFRFFKNTPINANGTPTTAPAPAPASDMLTTLAVVVLIAIALK